MNRRMTMIEWMGIIGLLFWGIVIVLRKTHILDTSSLNAVSLVIWTAPNFGGAWFFTSCFKQCAAPAFSETALIKVPFTTRVYMGICLLVFAVSIILEALNPYLLGGTSGFDIYDMMAAAIAELLMFTIPVLFASDLFES